MACAAQLELPAHIAVARAVLLWHGASYPMLLCSSLPASTIAQIRRLSLPSALRKERYLLFAYCWLRLPLSGVPRGCPQPSWWVREQRNLFFWLLLSP